MTTHFFLHHLIFFHQPGYMLATETNFEGFQPFMLVFRTSFVPLNFELFVFFIMFVFTWFQFLCRFSLCHRIFPYVAALVIVCLHIWLDRCCYYDSWNSESFDTGQKTTVQYVLSYLSQSLTMNQIACYLSLSVSLIIVFRPFCNLLLRKDCDFKGKSSDSTQSTPSLFHSLLLFLYFMSQHHALCYPPNLENKVRFVRAVTGELFPLRWLKSFENRIGQQNHVLIFYLTCLTEGPILMQRYC